MTSTPISVIIPVKNEGTKIVDTVASIISGRSKEFPIELVIVDDGSSDRACEGLKAAFGCAINVNLKIRALGLTHGIPYARNRGAEVSTYPICLMTDGNTLFPPNWDLPIGRAFHPNRILAGTIADTDSNFLGFGCTLILPSMGTCWIASPASGRGRVPVSASSCTVIDRNLFHQLGGYDESLPVYGAAEPEFSLRAWLHGYEIANVPDFVEFITGFALGLSSMLIGRRSDGHGNYLRFACYYLPEDLLLRTYDHYAASAPDEFGECIRDGTPQSAWKRREELLCAAIRLGIGFARLFNLTCP